MKNELINTIEQNMAAALTPDQQRLLHHVLQEAMENVTVTPTEKPCATDVSPCAIWPSSICLPRQACASESWCA